jgi:RNA polymerase sigma-70 factor (family 1)
MAESEERSDEEVLDLLRAGDPRAPSLLFNAHYSAVYNNARKFIKSPDVAKDITQELFINVWEKRNVLNITIPIRKYLLSAVHNRVINYRRDTERSNRLMHEVIDRSGGDKQTNAADVNMEAKELEQNIKKAIGLLPDHLRKHFSMSRNLDMTYKEMALHLRVSEKAIEKNMTKALKLMRLLLADYLKLWLMVTLIENY